MKRSTLRWTLITALLLGTGCDTPRAEPELADEESPCPAEAEQLVKQLGERMRTVSLLAPDSVAANELSRAYQPLVTPELLAQWRSDPASAPGREVSNPWPRGIAVAGREGGGNTCRVMGDVVYVTSGDTATAAEQRAVQLELRNANGWRISSFSWGGDSPDQVVRSYYDAIRAQDYQRAYALWADSGRASGQSFEEFRAGFADTEQVQVTVRDSVSIEGAAGSHYATVPVSIEARLRDGTRQQFEGSYTLRRSLVTGATAEERRWHIYSADIRAR